MQTAAFGFTLYSVFSISENLIQFPFHGARLGKFQRIGLTDMVGGDAVTPVSYTHLRAHETDL